MADEPTPINLVQDHNCFGCGTLNLHGLQLQLVHDEVLGGVVTRFTPDTRFEGYGGMVHGGIVSTVLDEVMAWSLYQIGAWGVTAKMEVRFRQPMRIGDPTIAIGRIVRERGRLFELAGEVRRMEDNALIAEATATFMRVAPEQAEAWQRRYNTGGSNE
jgi:acyl-coenzyme A thioesterase PaaI-like protein